MQTLISADNAWMLFAILALIAAAALWMEQRYRWAAKVSACMLCLIFAMILANFRVIPTDAGAYDFVWGYIVPLAIPFLLFQADLRKIWKESGRMVGIFFLSSLGTTAGGILAFALLKNAIGHADAKCALSMFVGTYVGGSVNLVAMADATGARQELVSASIVADNFLMVLYFFVLVIIPGIGWVLKHYSHPLIAEQKKHSAQARSGRRQTAAAMPDDGGPMETAEYWKAKPVSILDLSAGIAAACMIVAVSKMLGGFFQGLFPGEDFLQSLLRGLLGNQYLLITTITTLLATLFPGFFGSIGGSQEIGTFLIHIFFAVIGAPASLELIIKRAPLLFLFAAVIVMMNLLFSMGLGKLFRYSIEEITVASNANIGGPTTSAAFAIAKGWHSLIVPALLTGTLGYVIGNYYGIFLFTTL